MSGNDNGAIAVYTFNENGGTKAYDTSVIGAPLDLDMSTDGNLPTADGTPIRINASLQNGYLLMNPKPNAMDQGYQSAQRHRTFLISADPASKLSTCTNGFTIQAFIRPWFPFQGSNAGNMIVGLSNSQGQTMQQAPNFGIYQTGNVGAESISVKVRTGTTTAANQASVPAAFSSIRENDNPGALTEVIATQEPSGVLTVYVNRMARSSLTAATANFNPDAKLVVGNELIPLTLNPDSTVNVAQQSNWSGEIHHLAIYCSGVTRPEIVGAILENKTREAVVQPQTSEVSANRQLARQMVERLAAVAVPLDHPMVLRVEEKLNAGDRIGAAKIITGDIASNEAGHPQFYNTLVKQMAMKMSNREETIRAEFNDFAASFIGVTRDETNAQELLTGNFFYMADTAKVAVRSDIFRDTLVSNNHYEDLESGNWDLGKVLVRVQGQKIATSLTGGTSEHPDPAGVLTSRAFMSANGIAGTNRRLVEYAFRQFECMPLSEMADTSASPARIGRDIDRLPGGDAVKFETSCKGCHTVMDGFRGAFAKFDYTNITINNNSIIGFVRNTEVSGSGEMGFKANEVDQYGTVRKMNHNENTFPNGYTITDASFVNNAVGSVNKTVFGWSGPNKIGGVGVGQFGRMLADSKRFSQCMAKRVFEAVCEPAHSTESSITDVVDGFATKFRDGGYKLKSLFQEIAASPACLKQE